MSFFVTSTPAPAPRIPQITQVSLFYAGLLVIMAVTQLFTFDSFNQLIYSFNLPISLVVVSGFPAIIIASEVFALPFLLRMSTSVAFRCLSMFLGWLVAGLWLFVSICIVNSYPAVNSVGFLGTVIDLVPGWWAVSLSLLFATLAAWASWGLWPARLYKK